MATNGVSGQQQNINDFYEMDLDDKKQFQVKNAQKVKSIYDMAIEKADELIANPDIDGNGFGDENDIQMGKIEELSNKMFQFRVKLGDYAQKLKGNMREQYQIWISELRKREGVLRYIVDVFKNQKTNEVLLTKEEKQKVDKDNADYDALAAEAKVLLDKPVENEDEINDLVKKLESKISYVRGAYYKTIGKCKLEDAGNELQVKYSNLITELKQKQLSLSEPHQKDADLALQEKLERTLSRGVQFNTMTPEGNRIHNQAAAQEKFQKILEDYCGGKVIRSLGDIMAISEDGEDDDGYMTYNSKLWHFETGIHGFLHAYEENLDVAQKSYFNALLELITIAEHNIADVDVERMREKQKQSETDRVEAAGNGAKKAQELGSQYRKEYENYVNGI